MPSDCYKKVNFYRHLTAMQRVNVNVKRVVAIFIVATVVLYFGFIHKTRSTVYGLMFDAGSTGSRIHVYSFNSDTGALLNEVFVEVKPGLSSYKSPEEAALSLKPLMDVALASVPKERHTSTPISLKATAGLRMLGTEKADAILEAVRKYFATYPFKTTQDCVKILEGSDEGVYAWVTVNYLLGRLGKQRQAGTVAIMDLGGGSTQIVFEPSEGTYNGAAPGQIYPLTFGGQSFKLFQTSYEKFGLMKGREKILSAKKGHTCIPKGTTLKIKVNDVEQELAHTAASFEECLEAVTEVLQLDVPCASKPCSFNGVFQPDIADRHVFSSDMYAFSYFYDRTHIDGPQPEVTVATFKEMAKRECSHEKPDAAHQWQCIDLAYMYSLLNKGYRLPDHSKLNIAKKINGVETAWALGAMIIQMGTM
jgi:guanosine-diphosphatase